MQTKLDKIRKVFKIKLKIGIMRILLI